MISQRALRDFAARHGDAARPLDAWRKLVEKGFFQNLAVLKRTFASVDMVRVKSGDLYVFDIGGNKYRLITAIHFNTQMLFVRHVLTHVEYDSGGWKK